MGSETHSEFHAKVINNDNFVRNELEKIDVIPPTFEIDLETGQLIQTSDEQRIEFKLGEDTTELMYRTLPVSSSITSYLRLGG